MDDKKKESTVARYITLAYRILRISRLFWVDNFRNNLVINIQCGILIIMMAVSSQMEVYQSYKFKDYSTALSNKDFEFFSENLFYFVQIIVFSLPMRVAVLRLEATILLKWRAWTTGHFMKLYLSNKNYYKFVVNVNNSTSSDLGTEDRDNKDKDNNNNKNKNNRIDNPDQRISADIDTFTRNTFHYVTDVFDTTIRFVSFAPILWEINPTLFIFLVVYSAVGTYIATFFFGKKMAELNYNSRQLEADFRYSIVRIRDNAESIAFYGGEETELNDSMANFSKIVSNSKTQQWWSQWLMLFRKFWNFIAQLIPTVITTAQYFEGNVEFGSIAQADIVFNGVKDALFNVIDNFNTITSLYTTVDRLEIFLEEPKVNAEKTKIESKISEDIDFDDVTLKTPNYKRLLWKNVSFSLPQGESMLVVGHSGCGKSSLFRALARLWDSGTGTVSAPAAKEFFILPQHPYAPLGSLRHLLLYPHFNNYAKETPPTDKEMMEVLQEVNLKSLIDVAGDLEGTVEWSAVLSLGEMQRVSFARLLLAKRKYALLDEATSALDLHNEEKMYKLLVDKCPTFISISHRPSLHKFHQFVLEINDEQGYQFSTADKYHFKDE